MFSRYQFLQRLTSTTRSFLEFKAVFNSLSHSFYPFVRPNKAFQIPLSRFNYSSNHVNSYVEDLKALPGTEGVDLAYVEELMNKYATCKDLKLLEPAEVEWISNLFCDLMEAYWENGDHEKALKYLKEADDFQNKVGIKDTYDNAYCHFMGANIYSKRQDYVKAKEYLEDVERICKLLDENNQVSLEEKKETRNLRVQSWQALGAVYYSTNQEEKTFELYDAVLANIQDVEANGAASLLSVIYSHMRSIYGKRGDMEKYNEYRKKELDLAIKFYGENSKEVLSIHRNLANTLNNTGKFTEALSHGTKALQIAIQIHSENSRTAAWSYSLLGNIYKSTKDYTKALENYEKAIEVIEKLPEDQGNAQFKNEFYSRAAETHQLLGNTQEANKYLSKTNQQPTNSSDLFVAQGLVKQGIQYQMQRAYKEAHNLYRKALDIYEKGEPLDYAEIGKLYGLMGHTLYHQKEWSQAVEMWKEYEKYLLKINQVPPHHVYLLMANAYTVLEKYDDCFEYNSKFISAAESAGDNLNLGRAYFTKGGIFNHRRMYKEALEAFQKAEKLNEQQLGKEDPETLLAAEYVVKFQELIKSKEQPSS